MTGLFLGWRLPRVEVKCLIIKSHWAGKAVTWKDGGCHKGRTRFNDWIGMEDGGGGVLIHLSGRTDKRPKKSSTQGAGYSGEKWITQK